MVNLMETSMMNKLLTLCSCLLMSLSPAADEKTQTYREHLQQAESAIYSQDYALADQHFEQAFRTAATDTEKALALGKRAHMLAYKQKKYSEAMRQVGFARRYKDIKPVAAVTLYLTEAECLMKDGETYTEAATILEKAVALEGVDWALPGGYLKLGDCYRLSGRPEKAIEAYQKVLELPKVTDKAKSVAWLNIGMTYQYPLRDEGRARSAYDRAVKLDEGLASAIAVHEENFQ